MPDIRTYFRKWSRSLSTPLIKVNYNMFKTFPPDVQEKLEKFYVAQMRAIQKISSVTPTNSEYISVQVPCIAIYNYNEQYHFASTADISLERYGFKSLLRTWNNITHTFKNPRKHLETLSFDSLPTNIKCIEDVPFRFWDQCAAVISNELNLIFYGLIHSELNSALGSSHAPYSNYFNNFRFCLVDYENEDDYKEHVKLVSRLLLKEAIDLFDEIRRNYHDSINFIRDFEIWSKDINDQPEAGTNARGTYQQQVYYCWTEQPKFPVMAVNRRNYVSGARTTSFNDVARNQMEKFYPEFFRKFSARHVFDRRFTTSKQNVLNEPRFRNLMKNFSRPKGYICDLISIKNFINKKK